MSCSSVNRHQSIPIKKGKVAIKCVGVKKPSNFASAHQSRTSLGWDVVTTRSVLAKACLKIDLKGLRKTPLFWTFANFFKNVPGRLGPSETNFPGLLDELFHLVYTVKKKFWEVCNSYFQVPYHLFMCYIFEPFLGRQSYMWHHFLRWQIELARHSFFSLL